MVQLYNPNIVGKPISIDVKNISSDKLKLDEDINCLWVNLIKN